MTFLLSFLRVRKLLFWRLGKRKCSRPLARVMQQGPFRFSCRFRDGPHPRFRDKEGCAFLALLSLPHAPKRASIRLSLHSMSTTARRVHCSLASSGLPQRPFPADDSIRDSSVKCSKHCLSPAHRLCSLGQTVSKHDQRF